MIATLSDAAQTSQSADFLLFVDDGCEADVVELVQPIEDFTYDVADTAILVQKEAVWI